MPIIQVVSGNSRQFFACNSRDNKFEETAPENYTSWFVERNRIVGENYLRKVVRLLKYLRDVKGSFSVKSILLTTLAGIQIGDADELLSDTFFSDLPTSIKTIINRLDDFLQAQPIIPVIENPVLRGEDFNRHWDQAKYENFRNKIHQYREWIDDAYDETENDESIAKWRMVFGDGFAPGVAIKESSSVLAPLFAFADRWIAAIRDQGLRVLETFPTKQEHVAAPLWPVEDRIPVTVRAGEASLKNGEVERELSSGMFVPVGRWIKFTAQCPSGLPTDFRVWWQVANTGGHAARAGHLRGGFWPSMSPGVRWEPTRYRGVHWVEAFVVNRRTDRCVGKSDPFFIVIE